MGLLPDWLRRAIDTAIAQYLPARYGGFDIRCSRLASIHGAWDPWRETTQAAIEVPNRFDTASQPYKFISGAIHHFDGYGVPAKESNILPGPVAQVQSEIVAFVQGWLSEAS
ncbi:uncharacterized protein L969DRAFT_96617 [Mixia osmundae IAM 14324]|uniref:Uncharacterized protein n=1 Tax=Mixia osmundae (strain CBS 9802 / IAM 14324 / JCM 22182 / KY 12970) TaxID=764103 RepID=G7EAZ1_MIXOS|nr:uncharacterized protein L969DRAFT_96617 [Mixia osmundae IAM 14324]KEI37037.1 hypothetical protein L969DRAFT_96617 [Mixia osmundae IAM 14324]GAB00002.1 hypothetical protein E5Q_06704 [Mixia osmundae IAM 14324]